jgi:hypothetical protein
VSRLRIVLILCSVLALTACSSSSKSSQPADTQQVAQAPPAIEAIDEPADVADYVSLLEDPDATSVYWCLDQKQTNAREDCQPTPDQAEKLRRQQEGYLQALQPAKGVEPRAIARLRLPARGPKSYARLVAWRNESDKLCVQTEVQHQGNSPDGSCIPGNPCGLLCLDISESGEGNDTLYLVSGVVDSKADELRMTFEDGRVVPYGLTGPLVPGFPRYRVFMLDLDRELYQRLELRLSDKVLAEETLSPNEIRLLRCTEVFPPVQPSQARRSPVEECLQRAAPK